MTCSKFLSGFLLFFILSTSRASSPFYDTTTNLTHTCQISPMVVCVDVIIRSKTCVDPVCLIYSGGRNISSCISPLIKATENTANSSNVTNINSTSSANITNMNNTSNTTVQTCNGTWIYPSQNTSFCFNGTSWNKTICSQNNVTCKINSTQCILNAVVYLGGFFNLNDKDGYGNIPAAELAIKQINNDNTTLQNLTLSLVVKHSTQSLLSYGTQALYKYLHTGPTKLMLLLPQENDIARTVAAYAGLKQWGTLQFSYGTTDNSLASDKNLFPRFFRLNPLAITYNRLRVAFVNSYNTDWGRDVGLLYYADTYYTEANEDLNKKLKAKSINVVANVGFKSNPAEALYILKKKNAHIILTSFPYSYGKSMFCKAFQLGMYGPHYVWITFVLMPFKFWVPKPNDNLECTEEEMNCIAENHFSFYGATIYKQSNLLINSNVTFSHAYNNLVTSTKNRSSVAPYVYDALWTMANILERARAIQTGKRLNNLTYGEETKLLEDEAYKTDFMGVTGRIRFYDNGNRKFSMNLLQVRANGYGYIVGNYDVDKESFNENDEILWQGFKVSEGGWRYKRTTTTLKWRFIELVLFIVWCILAALGMIYAIFCLVFIIIYRRQRSIKYSSPTINVLIILGCLLNFIAVVLYGVDYQLASESRMSVICKVRLWMFSLGFTLCIGGLWVKVWTLYQILIERKVYKKRKMEYWMFAIVVILLVVDVIYLTTWTARDGLYRSFETVTDQPQYKCFQKLSGNPFIATIWYIEICDCDNLSLWSAIFLTYKCLLLLFGAFMSWKVRKVYTRKLIDAQYCATLILLAVPFCVLGLIFAYTLRLYPTPHYGLFGIFIILYTYIVLGFLYGHKIINIFCRSRNTIKVRSKDETGSGKCCSGVIRACLAPIATCLATGCCCICYRLNCCKSLWEALLHGPKKNRGSYVKENEKIDYQIGDMPSDREKQIIILQKEIEKRDGELSRLRRNNRATLAVKETQTGNYFHTNDSGDGCHGSGHINEGYSDNEGENKQRGSGRRDYNRFKVYHRKLDFSHVGSKVDSGLDNKNFNKSGSIPISENVYEEPLSNDSDILALQKMLSEREKELAQLRAYLGVDPSSSTDFSSKIGSLASIGEEHDPAKTSGEREITNTNISSVAITVSSSDSDGESRKNGSDISNDGNISDVNNEQSGLLRGRKTALDQEIQQGILPHKKTAESEVQETSSDDNNQEDRKSSKSKVLSSAYGSSFAYISHYNAKRDSGKFKKKVRQLNSFGIFARKSAASDENTPEEQIDVNNVPKINIDKTPEKNDDSQSKESPEDKPESKDGIDEKNTSKNDVKSSSGKDNAQKSKSNVKIFNAPSNWSHVKSRLFDANANSQSSLKSSPSPRRRSKVGIEDDGDVKDKAGGSVSGEAGEAKKNRNGVKIFNSSSDYSHVKSRLFDPNVKQSNSENLLRPSPTIRRKSKVGIEDDGHVSADEKSQGSPQDNDSTGQGKENQVSKSRSNVKIFNAPSDYSNVKSRLFNSANKTDNKLKKEAKEMGTTGALRSKNANVSVEANKRKKEESSVV
ncbi:uncharacterized protein LOC114535870 [Dendronephthya gigantea]|uniref:uncharacterized protein LOC114535870 n=1 Tax=Dendronephthya gigantea TaxID=151771 RepID=UPI00106DCF14|nr:uncharacterized protein LOC114535870 [Dendronephthya gigantea]